MPFSEPLTIEFVNPALAAYTMYVRPPVRVDSSQSCGASMAWIRSQPEVGKSLPSSGQRADTKRVTMAQVSRIPRLCHGRGEVWLNLIQINLCEAQQASVSGKSQAFGKLKVETHDA